MTSCNGWKEVRLHGKNQVRVQVRHEIMTRETSWIDCIKIYIVITLEISHEGQFQRKAYDQVNGL